MSERTRHVGCGSVPGTDIFAGTRNTLTCALESAAMTTRDAACSCGQLSLKVEGDPIRISMCHCLACQRRTGSAFGIQARFASDRVRVTGRFNDYVRTSDEGEDGIFHFCPGCGRPSSTSFRRYRTSSPFRSAPSPSRPSRPRGFRSMRQGGIRGSPRLPPWSTTTDPVPARRGTSRRSEPPPWHVAARLPRRLPATTRPRGCSARPWEAGRRNDAGAGANPRTAPTRGIRRCDPRAAPRRRAGGRRSVAPCNDEAVAG